MKFAPFVVGGLAVSVGLVAACSQPMASNTAASAGAPPPPPASASSLQNTAVTCMRNNDLACAEASWTQYIKLRPADSRAIANLGMVLNKEDKDQQAIAQFEKDISMGEGAYDLFAYYADSLAKVGRTNEAIDWSYKSLKLQPKLVDVRERLSKLLVMQKRNYEALTLLSEFNEYLDEHGQSPYFLGNRMAIESALHDAGSTQSQERTALRLVKFGNAFYAPVSVGASGTQAFIVDTGATSVVINKAFIADSKVSYSTVRPHVIARLADGHEVDAKEVMIDRMMVGPIELDKVKALACDSCSLLLGTNALSSFTMNMTQLKGVDVATLVPRTRI